MLHYCCYEQIDLRFVSQGRVRTAIRRGGQFCCSFVANLPSKSSQKVWKCSEVRKSYCKNNKGAIFLPHSVVTVITDYYYCNKRN